MWRISPSQEEKMSELPQALKDIGWNIGRHPTAKYMWHLFKDHFTTICGRSVEALLCSDPGTLKPDRMTFPTCPRCDAISTILRIIDGEPNGTNT